MSLIPLAKYKAIMEVLPIFCVDIIVQNPRGEYLLVKRNNEPKKGLWWVLGGRLHKGEKITDAVFRKVKQESGLTPIKIQPIGYFELIKGRNPFGLPFDYHSISIVFKAQVNDYRPIKLDDQSLEFKFAKKLPADFNVKYFGVKS